MKSDWKARFQGAHGGRRLLSRSLSETRGRHMAGGIWGTLSARQHQADDVHPSKHRSLHRSIYLWRREEKRRMNGCQSDLVRECRVAHSAFSAKPTDQCQVSQHLRVRVGSRIRYRHFLLCMHSALHTYCTWRRNHLCLLLAIVSSGTPPQTMESGLTYISVGKLYHAKLCLAWENAFTHA